MNTLSLRQDSLVTLVSQEVVSWETKGGALGSILQDFILPIGVGFASLFLGALAFFLGLCFLFFFGLILVVIVREIFNLYPEEELQRREEEKQIKELKKDSFLALLEEWYFEIQEIREQNILKLIDDQKAFHYPAEESVSRASKRWSKLKRREETLEANLHKVARYRVDQIFDSMSEEDIASQRADDFLLILLGEDDIGIFDDAFIGNLSLHYFPKAMEDRGWRFLKFDEPFLPNHEVQQKLL
jgi:Na+-transporting methylmalonyl-CoA/oxaloacetate decarboxylase gamma subunit